MLLKALANFYEAEEKENDPPRLLKMVKVGVPLGTKISDFVKSALFDAFADEPFYVVHMQYFSKKYEKNVDLDPADVIKNGHEYNFRVKKWNAVSEEEAISTQQAPKLSENGAGDTCSAVEKSQGSDDKERSFSFLCVAAEEKSNLDGLKKIGTKTSSLVFEENGDESLIPLSLAIGDEIRKIERSKSENFPLAAVSDKVFEDDKPSDVVGNASEVEHKVEDKTQQMPSYDSINHRESLRKPNWFQRRFSFTKRPKAQALGVLGSLCRIHVFASLLLIKC